MERNEVVLGKQLKDTVSDFIGICTSRTEWLNGCVRVGLSPKADKDGKIPESQSFDIEQVIELGPGVLDVTKTAAPKQKTGGDRDDRVAMQRD